MNRFTVTAMVALAGCAPSLTPPSTESDPGRTTTIVSDGYGQAGVMVTSYHNNGAPVYDLSGSPADIWSVLPSVYGDLKIPIGTTDPATRTYGNTSLVLGRSLGGQPVSRYLSCGTDAFGVSLAERYRVTMSVVTILTPGQNGKTHVETRVSGSAANPSVSDARVECTSTGALEETIASRIRMKLALSTLKQ